MRCEEVREQLAEHLLGTLDERVDAEVREHLRGCASCRADMAALAEGVSTFAAAAHDLDPPEDLRERALTVLEREWAEAEPEARVLERSSPAREASDEPGPDQLAETADLSERARGAMAALTAGQRAALELAYFGGKTSAEVAELEGIPLGTAKTRIRTALLKLREALQEQTREV